MMRKSIVLLTLIAILAACHPPAEVTPTLIPAATTIPSLSVTATIQPTSISTLQIPFTITPSRTPQPTPTSSWTPLPKLPTLSPIEAETLVIDLLINNGGCKLPCWWGISLGETTWNKAQQYLATFSSIEGPTVISRDNVEYEGYSIYFSKGEEKYHFSIWNVHSIVEDIAIPQEIAVFNHQLNRLLTNNGQPGEVWLALMPYTPGGSFFYLILDYPDQGIIAEYDGSAIPSIGYNSKGEAEITSLKICPMGIAPDLLLASPKRKGDYFGMRLKVETFGDLLVSLQDETQMDLEDFYLTFKDAGSTTCFETFSETWP